MILANGCPKSGTHALMAVLARGGRSRAPGLMDAVHDGRTLRLRHTAADPAPIAWGRALCLGDRYFLHAHVRAAVEVPGFRVITVFRDPRNVLVSYMRWQNVPAVTALSSFFGRPFTEVYRGFLGWKQRGQCLAYEELGHVVGPPLYETAARDHDTWTGAPSDWRERWTDGLERAWRAAGGHDLVIEAGYA